MNTWRYLSNRLQISLVCFGLDEARRPSAFAPVRAVHLEPVGCARTVQNPGRFDPAQYADGAAIPSHLAYHLLEGSLRPIITEKTAQRTKIDAIARELLERRFAGKAHLTVGKRERQDLLAPRYARDDLDLEIETGKPVHPDCCPVRVRRLDEIPLPDCRDSCELVFWVRVERRDVHDIVERADRASIRSPDTYRRQPKQSWKEPPWKKFSWRRGTKGRLTARFAALRIRIADGNPQRILDKGRQHMPGEEAWLVGEWRSNDERKYYLSNLPADTTLKALAAAIKARWVCEQAHQQMKKELGLDHFEGRSWQGLHLHALMTMIAYAFMQHQRLHKAKREKKQAARPA